VLKIIDSDVKQLKAYFPIKFSTVVHKVESVCASTFWFNPASNDVEIAINVNSIYRLLMKLQQQSVVF